MTPEIKGRGVELPYGHTGSSYLYDLLTRAVAQFPEALGGAELPAEAQAFKQKYADAVVSFEAARIASPERSAIARFLCLESMRELRFVSEAGESPFEIMLSMPSEPLPLVRVDLPGSGQLVPSVSFEGKLHEGPAVLELAAQLEQRRLMTRKARAGLEWISQRARGEGSLSLRGERFVLLGAAAELSPAELLLEAGAEVLWIDLREPPVDRLLNPRLGGTLYYVKGGADLLAAPQAVAATVRQFAERGPVHVGMYAYAGGASQEWRLSASMNGIVRQLPRALVKSVATLISPTTPCIASPEDASAADERKQRAPGWKRALVAAGRLVDGYVASGDRRVLRAIVPTQGVSYQAAQYLGKILAAEAYAVYGNALDAAQPASLTVSANVAPITATRSLTHPVFEAAFLGAPLFDILIAKPSTTRALAGLLALHDLLNPDAPGAAGNPLSDRASAIFTQQIHGGVFALPYALEGCITVAALRGLAQKPQLALGLFR